MSEKMIRRSADHSYGSRIIEIESQMQQIIDIDPESIEI